MGVEPGFLSSHAATAGSALVQTSPNFQALNGESSVTAGTLMGIDPRDGKAYRCNPASARCVPAGFAATDHPLGTAVDDTAKITLIRQGRIRGFSGLVAGAIYYPSADTPGAVVPERGPAGPVIASVATTSGTGFLRNVHIRSGHRPLAGDWTIEFPTATTCRITRPGGLPGAAVTVAANSVFNGSITGAEDFFIETRTLAPGDAATITVSYTTAASAQLTPDSPGNAITGAVLLGGMAGTVVARGLYKVVTTATTATVGFNGGAQSPARTISAGGTVFDLIPGIALTFEADAVTAETNYLLVDARELASPVGIAVNESTLQILMGGAD